MTHGKRYTWWAVLVLLALVSLLPIAVQAQNASPSPDLVATLIVSLRNEQDAPVGGASIIVRNADIDGEIGRVATAADGTATMPLPASVQTVRVDVTGQMPSGMLFTHQASDIGGILFFPGALGETRLDLVVTDDALVLPDPSMWTLDPVPTTEATMPPFDPTGLVASPPVIAPGTGPTPTILASTPARGIAATPGVGGAISAPAASRGIGPGDFVLLLIAGLFVVGGILLVVRRRR